MKTILLELGTDTYIIKLKFDKEPNRKFLSAGNK